MFQSQVYRIFTLYVCRYRSCQASDETKLQKVYVYWICPDTNAFEWFADLLKSLEDQMTAADRADFLTYNIYLTKGWDANQVSR
jgi:hypothetical protein